MFQNGSLNDLRIPAGLCCAARWRYAQAVRFFAFLLLVPFLAYSTLSQGTMLEHTEEDGMRVVLCTGTDMVEMIMAADGRLRPIDETQNQDHKTQNICDWAIHAQSALAASASTADLPVLIELSTRFQLDVPQHARRAEVLTPAARGPPSLV